MPLTGPEAVAFAVAIAVAFAFVFRCHPERSEGPPYFSVAFSVACPFVVIPQRSEGICICL
jgi:hypothetical protein